MASRYDHRQFWKEKPMLFIDTETGGRDGTINPTLTVGMIMMVNHTLFDPNLIRIRCDKPEFVEKGALAVNGINLDEHNAHPDTVSTKEASQAIRRYVTSVARSVNITGHNLVGFDSKFLSTLMFDYDDLFFHTQDTVLIARFMIEAGMIDLPNTKLETLCQYFNIDQGTSHSALDDAISTANLYLKMQKLLKAKTA